MAIKFDGSSGRKPQTEARRYIYRVMAAAIQNEVTGDRDGWIFGGMENESDRRRLLKAADKVYAELMRKGDTRIPRPA